VEASGNGREVNGNYWKISRRDIRWGFGRQSRVFYGVQPAYPENAKSGVVIANSGNAEMPRGAHCGFMNINRLFLPSVFFVILLAGIQASASDAKVISLSAYNTLRFIPNKIEVHPGQKIILTLKSESNIPRTAMQHDWVLLRAGSDPKAYARAALTAKADNYMPKALAGEVIVGVPLLGPQETRTVTFNAPTAPGSYPFLCSSPGHNDDGMNGVLVVK